LLRHFDAVVLFHELGHGIHDIVAKTRYSRFHGSAGTTVDFGELPAQLLELWFWTPSVLKSLSFHYSYLSPEMLDVWKNMKENKGKDQPEKNLPDSLIDDLIKARKTSFGPLFILDQIRIAMFDMTIHQPSSNQEAESLDLAVTWNKLRKDLRHMDGLEECGFDYTWGHGYAAIDHFIQEDYTAGYNSYLMYDSLFAIISAILSFNKQIGSIRQRSFL